MLFAAGMAASCLFMLLGIFLKKLNPFLVLMPIMWVILFLSGTFSKEIFIPGVSDYLPPALIQSAAFDLTLFGHADKSVVVLVVSVVLIIAATIVGTILFNRKAVAQ
jgi:ABC-2 type transport system permease protein